MSLPVTIIVAFYNHAAYVDDAVRALAAQDYEHLRLIVCDDASTDGTRPGIEQALATHGLDAVRLYHDVNRGLCATLNEALALVDTPLMTVIAGDDWMTPDSVRVRVEALLRARPNTALIYSDMHMVDHDGSDLGLPYSRAVCRGWPGGQQGDVYGELLTWDWIPAPTVLLRTDAVRSVFGYDEGLAFEDYDLWLRLARHYHLECVPRPLVHYRQHPGSMTSHFGAGRRLDFLRSSVRLLLKHIGAPGSEPSLSRALFQAAVQGYTGGLAHWEVVPAFRYAASYGVDGAEEFLGWATAGVAGSDIKNAFAACGRDGLG